MKRKSENSSTSSSSPSPSHSLPENDSTLSQSKSKMTKNATSSSTPLEVLDGLYMVKSQEHNKNIITSKDLEKSPNGLECNDKELIFKKENTSSKVDKEQDDDNSIRKSRIYYKDEQTIKDSRSISPSSTNVLATTSTSASLFQPYLDIEKK